MLIAPPVSLIYDWNSYLPTSIQVDLHKANKFRKVLVDSMLSLLFHRGVNVYHLEEELETTYVSCKVLPGLFDTELYVLINESSSAYVTRNSVKLNGAPKHGVEVDGHVLVYVVSKD